VISPISEKFQEYINEAIVHARAKSTEYTTGGIRRLNMLVLMGLRRDLSPIVRALEAVTNEAPKNKFSAVAKFLFNKSSGIVLCDSRHLAMALSHISSNRKRGYTIKSDITLVRMDADTPSSGIPSTVKFRADGLTEMMWVENGKAKFSAKYSSDGTLVRALDLSREAKRTIDVEEFPAVGDMMEAIDAFEQALLDANGMHDFAYDPNETHIVHGENGDMMVRRNSDRELHNEHGPAIIVMPKTNKERPVQHYFNDGKYIDEREFHARKVTETLYNVPYSDAKVTISSLLRNISAKTSNLKKLKVSSDDMENLIAHAI
jgi:hypothetical protein